MWEGIIVPQDFRQILVGDGSLAPKQASEFLATGRADLIEHTPYANQVEERMAGQWPCNDCGKPKAPWAGTRCEVCHESMKSRMDKQLRPLATGDPEEIAQRPDNRVSLPSRKIGLRGHKGQVWWQMLKGRGGR